MFSFLKKTKAKPNISSFDFIYADIHSHLLPGIDDGVKTLDEALQLIEDLHKMGFRRIITTPHIMWDYYPNTTAIICEKGEEMRQAIAQAGIDIQFDYAAEYFLDDHFEELLAKEDLLTLPGRHLLFELSFHAAPSNLEYIIFQMMVKRYVPVLAHPERYIYWQKNEARYERLKDLGCRFQCNLLSLAGYYGHGVKKNAEWLFYKEMIDFCGTDVHNNGHIDALQKAIHQRHLKCLSPDAVHNAPVFGPDKS